MPVRYVIHKEQRLVLSIAHGHVTTEELDSHRNRLLRDPHFNPAFDQITDYTGMTKIDLDGPRISSFALNPVFSQNSKRAIVVSKPAHFGLGRQYASYHRGKDEVQVFYDWGAALKWLGLRDISCPLASANS